MTEENKMIELDGAQVFSDWDKIMGTSNIPSQTQDEISLDNLMTDGGEDHWLQKFRQTNMTNMDLVAVKLIPTYTHDFKAEQDQLKAQTHNFLRKLPHTNMDDLRIAGLSEDQIQGIASGILPINWTIHLKYPLAYGGVITITNLVLIPQYPFHESLHDFINQQIITDAGIMTPPILYIPVPKSAIYIPFASTEMTDTVIHFETMGVK